MPGPRCKKHDIEKQIVEVKGKNGRTLHVVACSKCQAEKNAAAPPAPPAGVPEKKTPQSQQQSPQKKARGFWDW